METFNNALLATAVSELSKLPGIGSKTALRLALHLLRQSPEVTGALTGALNAMRSNICYCHKCHNISDTPICSICSSPRRDPRLVCVVENVRDVMALEDTHEYEGLYHVLGGLISPINGISPSDLEIDSLIQRVANEKVDEVILALSPTLEGDTTNYYIYRRLMPLGVKVTTLARGLTYGNELELTDQLTLGRSVQQRIPFENTFNADDDL